MDTGTAYAFKCKSERLSLELADRRIVKFDAGQFITDDPKIVEMIQRTDSFKNNFIEAIDIADLRGSKKEKKFHNIVGGRGTDQNSAKKN